MKMMKMIMMILMEIYILLEQVGVIWRGMMMMMMMTGSIQILIINLLGKGGGRTKVMIVIVIVIVIVVGRSWSGWEGNRPRFVQWKLGLELGKGSSQGVRGEMN